MAMKISSWAPPTKIANPPVMHLGLYEHDRVDDEHAKFPEALWKVWLDIWSTCSTDGTKYGLTRGWRQIRVASLSLSTCA
jgi:hypothetical protein